MFLWGVSLRQLPAKLRQIQNVRARSVFPFVRSHKKSRSVVVRTVELNRAQSLSAHVLRMLFDHFNSGETILISCSMLWLPCSVAKKLRGDWHQSKQEPVEGLYLGCAHGWLWYRGWGIEDVPEQGHAAEMQLCSSCRFTQFVRVKLFSSLVNHVSSNLSTTAFSARCHID